MTSWLLLLFCTASFLACLLGQGTVDNDCLYCLCMASSGCRQVGCHKYNDGGYYCGPFQITFSYWNDSGRPVIENDHSRAPQAFERCLTDFQCAAETIVNYMNDWVKDCDGDNSITCFDYARVHKAGPFGCDGDWALKTHYWQTFMNCMNSKL